MNGQTLNQILDTTSIKKAELFNLLSEEEAEYICRRSGIVQLRKKARLFSAGQKARHFYMLLEGSIRVYKTSGGVNDEIARYASGDIIGDFDFACKAEYNADAEAEEDSLLIMFPAMGLSLENITEEEPRIVSRILLNSIVMTTGRIKSTQKILLENLSWVKELHRRAYEDPGTGLWRHSFLGDEIDHVLEVPTALIMLKPNRFKLLVDTFGHAVGDEAMVRIAMILKGITRRIGRGWPLRFKSNETGILINKCSVSLAEMAVRELSLAVSSLDPVPAQGEQAPFQFSGTISYALWPEDGRNWEELFEGCYSLLLKTWKEGNGKITRFRVSRTGEKNNE